VLNKVPHHLDVSLA